MKIITFLLITAVLFTVIASGAAQARTGEPGFELLSVEEANRPAEKNFGFAATVSDSGPSIGVQNLEVKESEPFSLEVRLNARDGAAPDLATLRLECLKSPAIDLTPRVQRYITKEGLKIDKTSLPPGLHHFRVGISDVRGRFSEKDFTIMVSGNF